MPRRPPTIPKDWFAAYCRPGQGAATCRYPVAGRDGLCCAKGSTIAETIDDRVRQGLFVAKAVGCSGPCATCQATGRGAGGEAYIADCPDCRGVGFRA